MLKAKHAPRLTFWRSAMSEEDLGVWIIQTSNLGQSDMARIKAHLSKANILWGEFEEQTKIALIAPTSAEIRRCRQLVNDVNSSTL